MAATAGGLCAVSVYCYFGSLTTEHFLEMADSLYKSNWPDLPIALQKHCVLMIAEMHKPIYFHGLGMVKLNLETLLKVRIIPNCIAFDSILFIIFYRSSET